MTPNSMAPASMTAPTTAPEIQLSSTAIDVTTWLHRESPRTPEQRNAFYDFRFDWDTLFYDVYRVGKDIVFQGPPYFNLFDPLKASAPFDRAFSAMFNRAQHIGRDKRGEIWLRSDADSVEIDGPIGRYSLKVQPNMSALFAGKRVIHSLSKNNAPRWIEDWVRFYRNAHGAEAALLYDNNSTDYTAADMQARLNDIFPDMVIRVVLWPFKYGPQGGVAGAVNGKETPWDSDFCQTGSMQHARLRFLREASSVLNADIDEMVLPIKGQSIFEATERSATGFIKFPGIWISTASPEHIDPRQCRHADFVWRDLGETRICPPKWCIVPATDDPHKYSWSVHNVFGSRQNRTLDRRFYYRHMMGISNSWKERRWGDGPFDPAGFECDSALEDTFAFARMPRSTGADDPAHAE